MAGNAFPPAGHSCPYRQRREVVARQESFAGEIPVGIKVAFLTGGVDLQQQIALAESLLLSGRRLRLLIRAPRPQQRVLRLDQLTRRSAIQLPLAVKSPVEVLRCCVEHAVNPRVMLCIRFASLAVLYYRHPGSIYVRRWREDALGSRMFAALWERLTAQ